MFDISGHNSDTMPKCDFGWVKVSEGRTYRSGSFPAQWRSAKVNAKARGGYHFARPEESSAIDQCDRFLDILQPAKGEAVMLDLEASKLSQSATNAWARKFGDRLWDQVSGVVTFSYFGGGYATNGTGKDLNQHFNYWMYPQYPSVYQLIPESPGRDLQRAINRTSYIPDRELISTLTNQWPAAMTYWLPKGAKENTGWSNGPGAWQFTDNHFPGGLDASISSLTLPQITGNDKKDDTWQTWFLGTSG